jgi:hypothetical protein
MEGAATTTRGDRVGGDDDVSTAVIGAGVTLFFDWAFFRGAFPATSAPEDVVPFSLDFLDPPNNILIK